MCLEPFVCEANVVSTYTYGAHKNDESFVITLLFSVLLRIVIEMEIDNDDIMWNIFKTSNLAAALFEFGMLSTVGLRSLSKSDMRQ